MATKKLSTKKDSKVHKRRSVGSKRKSSIKSKSTKSKKKVTMFTESEYFGKSMIVVSIVIVLIMIAMIYFLNKESLNPRLKAGGEYSTISNPMPGFTSDKFFEENNIEDPRD